MREVVLKRRGGAGGPPQLQSLVLLQNQADLLLVLLLLLERSRAERCSLLLGQSLRILLPAGSQHMVTGQEGATRGKDALLYRGYLSRY